MDELVINGKYKKLKKEPIGRGFQGKVFLCEDLTDKKKVAVKMFTDKYPENELQIMQECDSLFLVKLLESFLVYTSKLGAVYYIVMDLCEKGDLEKVIDGKKSCSIETIRKWSGEIINGLDYLHTKHIIHRDIKPANLYLTNDEHIKVGDLGISKMLNVGSMRFVSTYCGTLEYMSPEMKEEKSYSFNTDIWSAGCVIYELTTFRQFSSMKTLQNVESLSKELYELLKMY